jgi:hypothetical protein
MTRKKPAASALPLTQSGAVQLGDGGWIKYRTVPYGVHVFDARCVLVREFTMLTMRFVSCFLASDRDQHTAASSLSIATRYAYPPFRAPPQATGRPTKNEFPPYGKDFACRIAANRSLSGFLTNGSYCAQAWPRASLAEALCRRRTEELHKNFRATRLGDS